FRDAMTPVEQGAFAHSDLGVFVAGRYAYTADDFNGLTIVDMSDPSSPMLTGNLFTAWSADVWVSGDYAFAAGLAFGLRVIDVSNPAAPVEVAVHDTPGVARDVVVSGDLAYVADETSLRVINVNNPTAPSLLGSYSVTAYEVAVAGDHAFVAAGFSGLQVINVSNSAAPTFAGSFVDGRFVLALAVSGNFAYLAANGPNAFQVVDITNPSTPVLAATYTRSISGFAGVSVAGTHVYLATGDFGIDVIDVSNPAAPVSVGTSKPVGLQKDIFASGDFAYSVGTFALAVLRVRQDDNVHALHNVGQSTVLPITHTVARLRLTPTQNGTVNWGVYTGANLNAVPVNQWVELEASDQIKWRSTHLWSAPGVNPSVAGLLVDWRTTSGDIAALTDVPNDQGGWVRLEVLRSGYDFAGETTPIVQYFIQREFDDTAALSAGANSAVNRESLSEALASWPVEKPLLEWQGRFFTFDDASHGSAALAWEIVGSLPAIHQDVQFVSVPTLEDAGPDASPTVYRILTQSSAPGVFYTSPTISGFSIDNIAPGVPQGLVLQHNATGGNLLTWDPSADDDFQYFRIYRDTSPGFTPAPENLVHATAGTSWTDPDYHAPGVYYKVTALDYVGNESDPAAPEAVTGANSPPAPAYAALYQNQPNPFNPTTMIRYDVPTPGAYVELAVYDVAGRLVDVLISRNESAGHKTVRWEGRRDDGAPAASGVYLYRITIGNFAETRKMVLLK
ncbi:MAG TPA: FlgD immunoglobulin-like domain containing protein, partial [Candidatus Krumholzibacteria bacterium]|nr:FlgD immunoglobulin-like domain containing protein [Candidatus Krumholzibacteria bacterium]